MKRLINIVLSIMMVVTMLNVSFNKSLVKAEEPSPEGNSITLTADWNEGCKNLVDYSTGHYTLAGVEYSVYNYRTGEAVGTFVLDANGVGHEKTTGYTYIDNLPDDTYRIRMTKAVEGVTLNNDEYKDVVLKADTHLPSSITVNTLADVYGRNSSGSTTGWSSLYKFWNTTYGTGTFECAIAEIDPPSSIRAYGSHTISTSSAYVLDRTGKTPGGYSNELIYKIMYYTSDAGMWSGLKNVKNIPYTTRDKTNYTYYNTGQSDLQKVASFIRHVALSRAWGRDNGKWQVQQYQDGFTAFLNFVTNASTPNAPENLRVFVWEGYQSGVQDMMFSFMMQDTDYAHEAVEMKVKTEFDPVRLVLTKTGTSNEFVADAEFTFKYYTQDFDKYEDAAKYNAKGTWVFKTNEKGELIYSEDNKVSGDPILKDEYGNEILTPGTWTIVETKAPANYVVAEPFLIKVSADVDTSPIYLTADGSRHLTVDPTTGYALTELKEAYAQVKKTSVYKQSIAGAEYTVFEDANCTVVAKQNNSTEDAVLITKADGTTNTVAIEPNRKYWVKETKAPTGYLLDSTVYEITAGETETITVDSVEDIKRFTVKVVKVDANNHEVKVAGVKIGLFDKNDNNKLVEEKTTNASGEVEFSNVVYGSYYVQETETVYGYDINSTKFDVDVEGCITIVNDSNIITIEDNAKTISVKVVKIDSENNERVLEGAKFELRDGQTVLASGTTDARGNLKLVTEFKASYNGKLTLVEVEAPFGYKLPENNSREVTFDEDYTFVNDIEVTIENAPYHFDLEVLKVDADTNEKLPNAKFGLFDSKTDEQLMEAVTGAEGVAKFEDVAYGHYYIKEIEAPYGYELLDEKIDVVIDETYKFDEAIQKTIKDTAKTYNIAIHKNAADGSKRPIADCEFTLFEKETDEPLASVKTNREGIATFTNVPYRNGGYYVKETGTVAGYKLSDEVIDCQVDETFWDFTAETLDKNFENEAYDIRVHVIKTDGVNEVVIENTEFTLFYKYNDEIATDKNGEPCVGLTDENGELTWDVVYDEYYVKETKAAYGYIIDEATYDVEFAEDYEFVNEVNEAELIEVINKPYSFTLRVVKVDSKDKAPLAGATFELVRSIDDVVVATETSNADGLIDFGEINWCSGGYYLRETEAPQGYQLSKDVVIVDLENEEEFDFELMPEITYEITNTLIPVPKTGDHEVYTAAMTTMIASGLALAVAIIRKKKFEEEI